MSERFEEVFNMLNGAGAAATFVSKSDEIKFLF
jgi:hypothetical protein